MNNLFNLHGLQLKALYQSLTFHKSKDKIDMVLEPLQSMIQLALLSVCPIGTKLSIHENILYLQPPSLIQPFNRWYNSDKKDDLFFLFQVVKRFVKWYCPKKHGSTHTGLDDELYQLIVRMGLKGLDNLLKTYGCTENNTIVQVIHMYKNILKNNDHSELDKNCQDKIQIDEVFENIMNIYNANIINIIHSSLIMIETEEDPIIINNIVNGLNLLMIKLNNLIKNWIKINLNF
jgi:hypothetical protein